MSEMALVNARKSCLSSEAKKGSSTAKTVLKLQERPNNYLSTIQIGITLIGILTGIYSGDSIAYKFAAILGKWGVDASVAKPIANVAIVVMVTYVTLVIGELVPKRLGMSSPERIAKVMSGPMTVLSWLGRPFVWVLDRSTSAIVKFFRIDKAEAKVTEDEIISMIAEGTEDGEVQEVEQDIMERVFQLGDRKVETIMTNRNDIVWIDKDMTIQEIKEIVQENLFEVYPVGDGSLDKIEGVVFLKDLFGKLEKDDFKIASIIKPAQFFHEYMDVYKVMEQMKEQQVIYGLICDEFGICQGIVTYKDILEGLVGSIDNDEDGPEIIERDNGGWLVDGQCSFYDFLSHFDAEELAAENEYNTIGGLILENIEHIPHTGESVIWNQFKFEVVDMDGIRIDKVLVTKTENNKETTSQEQ